MRVTRLIDDYLLGWVLLAVAVGLLFPALAVITRFSTPILAIMVGSVSLTLSVGQFRAVDRRGLGVILLGHAAMPVLAYALATALGFSPALTAGFVLLGAVTPELVTPTMTALADGDTALASTALVLIGVASTAFIPGVTSLLLGATVPVDSWAIVEQLLLAVVGPMLLAVAVRTHFGEPVARREETYSTISALMVVLIICGVTAANATLVRENVDLLLVVGIAAFLLNAAGYGLGFVGAIGSDQRTRIATTLSVGMRDFAVAAALVVAAGFPPAASLPAVLFGVIEMATSAGLVRVFK